MIYICMSSIPWMLVIFFSKDPFLSLEVKDRKYAQLFPVWKISVKIQIKELRKNLDHTRKRNQNQRIVLPPEPAKPHGGDCVLQLEIGGMYTRGTMKWTSDVLYVGERGMLNKVWKWSTIFFSLCTKTWFDYLTEVISSATWKWSTIFLSLYTKTWLELRATATRDNPRAKINKILSY